jgi:hypothetical protein
MSNLKICIMKHKKIYWQLTILAVLSLSSCYPDGPDKVDELDVVETQYDSSYNFSQDLYFLLPDTVSVIGDTNMEYTPVDQKIDHAILNEIKLNMENAGYVQLAESDTSDHTKMSKAVIVLASKSIVDYYAQYYDYYYYGYDYWDWYYGMNYYYPDYRWTYYYPWGYPATYSHSVGTVIVEIIDPNNPRSVSSTKSEVVYPVRWMATFNGLAQGTLPNYKERIIKGIDQAFIQSPYVLAD